MHEEHAQESMTDAAGDVTTPPSTGEGDVLSLIADVERHLDRIRSVQSRQESEFADLTERQRRIAAAESSLEGRRRELDEVAAELARAQATNDAARAAVDRRRDELEGREKSLGEELDALAATRSELDDLREGLDVRAREIEMQVDDVVAREQEVRGRVEEAEAARVDAENRLAEVTAALTAGEASFAALTERHAALELERDASARDLEDAVRARDEAVEAMRHAVGRHEQEMAEAHEATQRYREALEDVGRRLEATESASESARSALETEVARLEGRCRELDEELVGRAAVIAEMQASVAELEDAVATRDARIESQDVTMAELEGRARDSESAMATAETRIEELEARTEEDQRQLRLAGSKLMELARVVSEQAPRLERGAEAMALVSELESEIERLRAEARDVAGPDVEAIRGPLDARILELERDLESARSQAVDPAAMQAAVEEATAALRAELEEARTSADGDVVARSRYEQVKDRCRRAERRSDELETALSLTNDRGQAQEMAKRLRHKAERIGDFARHLDRRKARLTALRSALRKQEAVAGPGGGTTFHELQRLEAQRRELEQVREFLSRSEQQMVRRWARPRSVVTVAWLTVMLAISTAAGWLGGTRFMPMPGAATVSLAAAPMNGRTLDAEAVAAWEAWHTALATDPAFVSLVAGRLGARGLMPPGGEPALASMLAEDLTFEHEGHGRLRLVLSGDDARTLEPTLDAIATTMASESARQAPRRIDGARATLPTERVTGGGLGYAMLVSGPYGQDALLRMGAIAGGVFAGCVLFVLLVYGVLSRSKRIFEAQADGDDSAI